MKISKKQKTHIQVRLASSQRGDGDQVLLSADGGFPTEIGEDAVIEGRRGPVIGGEERELPIGWGTEDLGAMKRRQPELGLGQAGALGPRHRQCAIEQRRWRWRDRRRRRVGF